MARLVGFIGNRPDLGARALAADKAAFSVDVSREAQRGSSASWGIGFYQGGEILLKRRPIDDRSSLDFGELVRGIKADVLVGHIRAATVGALRTENNHQFRYRQWIFAQTGTVPRFDSLREPLLESLPQFLARSVRGETDAELVFHLFLSFLHDAGWLDRLDVPPASVREAMRSTISLVDRLCAEHGAGPSELNFVLASGDFLVGLRAGRAMAYEVLAGRGALERLFADESYGRTKVPHLMSVRLALCASDFDDDRTPRGWSELQARSFVTLSRTDEPQVEPL
jgi:predicted glutamine amidotransferase